MNLKFFPRFLDSSVNFIFFKNFKLKIKIVKNFFEKSVWQKLLTFHFKLVCKIWHMKFEIFLQNQYVGGGGRIVEICWEHLRKIGLQQNFSHKILSTLVWGNRLKTLISGIWEHLKKTGQKTGFDGPNPPSTFRYKFCRCWRCLN